MSTLKVGTIQDHSNSTTAMTIDNAGRVFQPAKPVMAVRGYNANSANSGPFANFMEITGWSTVDVNIGGGLSNGRFVAPVTGNYHIEAWSQRASSTDYRGFFMYAYNGSSYTSLVDVYSANDYNAYTLGGSLIYPLTAGHSVLVGWDNAYANWNTGVQFSSFSCYLIG
jgi:hypothetical protein